MTEFLLIMASLGLIVHGASEIDSSEYKTLVSNVKSVECKKATVYLKDILEDGGYVSNRNELVINGYIEECEKDKAKRAYTSL